MSEEKTKRAKKEQPKLSKIAHMDEWGENQKGPKPNNQNCPALHPWMSEEETKRA